MIDIVNRLRQDFTTDQIPLHAEAADEIERLRADGELLIAAIERQLAMHGKGVEPSERVKEAIAAFRRA